MKVIVIYPGRFHPFHKGHKSVYDTLIKRFGKQNVFYTYFNFVFNILRKKKYDFFYKEIINIAKIKKKISLLRYKDAARLDRLSCTFFPDTPKNNTSKYNKVLDKEQMRG